MKFYNFLFAIIFTLFFVSCGEEMDNIRETADVVSKMEDTGKEMEKSRTEAEKRMEKRRAEGDTTAMHYKELQKFLPDNINGYEAQEPKGSTQTMGAFSTSEASRRYNKDGDFIEIKIMDHNMNVGMYSALTGWAKMNVSKEDDTGYERTFDPGNEHIVALEKFKHNGGRAEINYGVGYRFWLTIRGSGLDDTDKLKEVANKMPLKKMAKM
ncbi:MAG: hypothetical protein ACOC2K_01020, partial [Bacteroidota bacterium]